MAGGIRGKRGIRGIRGKHGAARARETNETHGTGAPKTLNAHRTRSHGANLEQV